MPSFCPECGTIMGKNTHDRFYWNLHKRCQKCGIRFEGQLRLDGTFDYYALFYMYDKLFNTCNSAIQWYQEAKKQHTREVLVNAEGETEQWKIDDAQQFNQTIDKVIQSIIQYRDQAVQYFEGRLKDEREKIEDKLGIDAAEIHRRITTQQV